MSLNSGFREAPPTKNPSIFGYLIRPGAVFALADPPYKILVELAISSDTLSLSQDLVKLMASSACSGEAVLPVPMAQTGS